MWDTSAVPTNNCAHIPFFRDFAKPSFPLAQCHSSSISLKQSRQEFQGGHIVGWRWVSQSLQRVVGREDPLPCQTRYWHGRGHQKIEPWKHLRLFKNGRYPFSLPFPYFLTSTLRTNHRSETTTDSAVALDLEAEVAFAVLDLEAEVNRRCWIWRRRRRCIGEGVEGAAQRTLVRCNWPGDETVALLFFFLKKKLNLPPQLQ